MSLVMVLEACRICGSPLIQAGPDLVCGSCGVIQEDGCDSLRGEVRRRPDRSLDLVDVSLGSFLGSKDENPGTSAGLGFEGRGLRYMKLVSDYGAKSRSTKRQEYVLKIVDRLGEALGLTRAVLLEAQHLAAIKSKEGGSSKRRGSAVAAYSVMMASRRQGQLELTWEKILQGLRSTGHPTTWKKILAIGIEGRTFNTRAGLPQHLEAAKGSLMWDLVEKGYSISEARQLAEELYRGARDLVDVVGRENLEGFDSRTMAWALLYLAEQKALRGEILRGKGCQVQGLLVMEDLARVHNFNIYTITDQVMRLRGMVGEASSQNSGRLGETGESQPAPDQAGRVVGSSLSDVSLI